MTTKHCVTGITLNEFVKTVLDILFGGVGGIDQTTGLPIIIGRSRAFECECTTLLALFLLLSKKMYLSCCEALASPHCEGG